jgi:hypothetical protein
LQEYSGIAEMLGIIGGFTWLGMWLDRRYQIRESVSGGALMLMIIPRHVSDYPQPHQKVVVGLVLAVVGQIQTNDN